MNSLPHVQRTWAATYSGWISVFIVHAILARAWARPRPERRLRRPGDRLIGQHRTVEVEALELDRVPRPARLDDDAPGLGMHDDLGARVAPAQAHDLAHLIE